MDPYREELEVEAYMAGDDDDDIAYPTEEELRVAEQRLLAQVGYTLEELQAQALLGRWETESARRAWASISWRYQ